MMRNRAAIALVAWLCLADGSVAETNDRPFTVADSISMTRLVDPDPSASTYRRPIFKASPQGASVLAVTRAGDLRTGLNEYRLLLFDGGKVRQYVNDLNSPGLPRPEVLATFSTASQSHGIDGAKWLPDGSAVAFIGRDGDHQGQVYVRNLRDGTLSQLTRHDGDIAMFDVNTTSGLLIYTAWQTPDWQARNAYGYAVESDLASDLTKTDPAQSASRPIKHFLKALSSDEPAIALKVGAAMDLSQVALSPDGKWAVVMQPVRVLPSHWGKYSLLDAAYPGAEAALGTPAFGRPSTWLWQFMLVETSTGAITPLLDAPSATSGELAKIRWASDSASVVVAPTHLPIDSAASAEGTQAAGQYIAEVQLSPRKAIPVAALSNESTDGRYPFLTDIEVLPEGRIRVHQRVFGGRALPAQDYRKRAGRWIAASASASSASALQFEIAEDMNTPPDIRARDRATGRVRTITEFNPALRDVDLGTLEEFKWENKKLGRAYVGGLLKPHGFRAGIRYPVVLQTYGFRNDQFLVDGPDGRATAFAARALAGRGLMVLQMPEVGTWIAGAQGAGASSARSEGDLFVAMMESAIDGLAKRGLVDEGRVGLIGFSRTGMHVLHAITFSHYRIAAATIADSIAPTPLSYALTYGNAPPGMLEWEQDSIIGAPFWKEGISRWMERSPLFHLDQIRAPLRYEHLGTHFPAYWDIFAILKRQRRPVEMFHIPRGTHLLESPWTRYASEEGNVDWFDFWLSATEDPSPDKQAQYARWRQLRAECGCDGPQAQH